MHMDMNREKIIGHTVSNFLSAAALIGGMVLLLGLLGWVFAGPTGWVWALVISVVLLIVSPKLSPGWVMRLYRARPLSLNEAPSVYAKLETLARRAGLEQLPALYYVPSQVANAFATGHRTAAAIGVTDGLLRQLSSRELNAVLAHEVSHLKHNDLWLQNLSGTLGRVTSFFFLAGQFLLFLNLPLVLMGGRHISWLAIGVLMVAPFASMMLQLALSRNREFSADLSAAELTGDPKGLASALVKIDQQQRAWPMRLMMWPGRPQDQGGLMRTHPATTERVKRLLALSGNRYRYRVVPQSTGSRFRWVENGWQINGRG